ncbi:MAG: DNA translocase FtsK 4TM domain-containing protein [Acidobacteriia bacterium]|nr:DNA translocase FtsK 4TM domain-containing protein [Terriglobia bacterium]
MKLLSPTQRRRLNEVAGFLLLSLGLTLLLSFVSYHAQDPSWSTATVARPLNLIGYPGSYLSDLLLQGFGAAAFLFPFLIFLLAWKWIRSEPVEAGGVKIFGSALLSLSVSTGLSFLPLPLFGGAVHIGGTLGILLAHYLIESLNLAGSVVAIATAGIVSIYLVSSFTVAKLASWFSKHCRPPPCG